MKCIPIDAYGLKYVTAKTKRYVPLCKNKFYHENNRYRNACPKHTYDSSYDKVDVVACLLF